MVMGEVDGVDRLRIGTGAPDRCHGGVAAIDQQGEAAGLDQRGGVGLVGVERIADAQDMVEAGVGGRVLVRIGT